MPYRKGPALPGARLEDIDFSNARLHAPNFEGAKITDAWFCNADISGDLEGLRLNGVEVAPLVVAELERRFPERAMLRAADPEGLADAWAMIDDRWQATLARARKLPEPMLYERVDDEWSFAETLRHLVLATDCWLRRMVKGIARPYHPWGVAGSWLTDPSELGDRPRGAPLAPRRSRFTKEAYGRGRTDDRRRHRRGAPTGLRPTRLSRSSNSRTYRSGVPACDPQRGVGAQLLRHSRPRHPRQPMNEAGQPVQLRVC